MSNQNLKYPIGKFIAPENYTAEAIQLWKKDIEELPALLTHAVYGLTNNQLETPYRPGGWTIRQVVHHVADSHINSIIRFKLALTENNPTIKPYNEAEWAKLADYNLPLEPSLQILEGVHTRLTALFKNFTEAEWNRTFIHPESGATISLKQNLALYSWHGRHHLAHIALAKSSFSSN